MTARGVARAETFKDAHDYRRFLRLFAEVVERFDWHCHAFCLMPNHYHLVMAAVQPRLSWGLHGLNGMYAQRFNRRHERWGHLFGDRFEARLIESERHLRRLPLRREQPCPREAMRRSFRLAVEQRRYEQVVTAARSAAATASAGPHAASGDISPPRPFSCR